MGVEEAANKLGGCAVGLACDMGDSAQIDALFDTIESEAGPVSILVNNAGIALPNDFLKLPSINSDLLIDVNLIGTFSAFTGRRKAWSRRRLKVPS